MHREASSLSALAVAGIPSHICTARMKAYNFHRSQFFESELQISVCFNFLFKVITHPSVVGKAWAITGRRGWVNYLKNTQQGVWLAMEGQWNASLIRGPLQGKAKGTPDRFMEDSLVLKIKQHFTSCVLGGEL